MKKFFLSCAMCLAFTGFNSASAQDLQNSGIGVRGGFVTAITGGLGYGLEVNKLINNNIEVGAALFGAHVKETTTDYYTYNETTNVLVVSALANMLYGYDPKQSGFYSLAGVGAGLFSVNWEETSAGDTSLGTPLPGGGSKDSADGTAAGTILNLGLGYNIGNNFDVRAEIPMYLIFSPAGDSAGFIPTFTVTLGYRF